MAPDEVERSMASGCFEIMMGGTRNAVRQMDRPPSGLRFNICALETSYLPNSEVKDLEERVAKNVSAELRYSCLHWVDHLRSSLAESSTYFDDSGRMTTLLSDFFETTCSLFWLEVLSLTGSVATARDMLVGLMQLQSLVRVARCFSSQTAFTPFPESCSFHRYCVSVAILR